MTALEHLGWLGDGAEHDFELEASGVSVDGGLWLSLAQAELRSEAVDVTTMGATHPEYLRNDVLTLAGEGWDCEVAVTSSHQNGQGAVVARGRVVSHAVDPTAVGGIVDLVRDRAMRDTPPSSDVGIACESCDREVPLRDATWDEDPVIPGHGEWTCRACYEWRS